MTPSSAPRVLANSSFAEEETAAITRAPMARPTSTAAAPTPPAAPSTSSVSPERSRPASCNAWYAVAYANWKAAASAVGSLSGILTQRSCDNARYSDMAPQPHRPITTSPRANCLESAPTCSTTPQNSLPGTSGLGGLTWYMSRINRLSGKFTPTARTRISNSPSQIVGIGQSSNTSDSGPPGSLLTQTFIGYSLSFFIRLGC